MVIWKLLLGPPVMSRSPRSAVFLERDSNIAEVASVGAGEMNLDFIFVGAGDANSRGAYMHAELAIGREVGCEMILTCFRDAIVLG